MKKATQKSLFTVIPLGALVIQLGAVLIYIIG
jgi:hypothetical protein